MSNLTLGNMYSCSDNGEPGNILSLVLADNNGGWNTFSFLFAGKNALGQNRIYAVNEGGQLLSYAPTNPLSGEVIVGADGWAFGQNFSAVFAGVNSLGENRIYAVTMPFDYYNTGQLLSYSDDGKPGNVGHPVVVGADGWQLDNIAKVLAGKDSAGNGRIYAVNHHGNLLSYVDDGKPGNVGHPVVVGKGIWMDMFMFLFAGANAAGQNRIYGVSKLGQLLSYAPTNPVSKEVIVGEAVVINGGTASPNGNRGWSNLVANATNSGLVLCVGVNSAGQNRIYGVYRPQCVEGARFSDLGQLFAVRNSGGL